MKKLAIAALCLLTTVSFVQAQDTILDTEFTCLPYAVGQKGIYTSQEKSRGKFGNNSIESDKVVLHAHLASPTVLTDVEGELVPVEPQPEADVTQTWIVVLMADLEGAVIEDEATATAVATILAYCDDDTNPAPTAADFALLLAYLADANLAEPIPEDEDGNWMVADENLAEGKNTYLFMSLIEDNCEGDDANADIVLTECFDLRG